MLEYPIHQWCVTALNTPWYSNPSIWYITQDNWSSMLYTTVYVLPLSKNMWSIHFTIIMWSIHLMSSDTYISLSLSYIWGMWYHHPILMYLCCGKQLEYKMINLYHKSALKEDVLIIHSYTLLYYSLMILVVMLRTCCNNK